ncbi:DUF2971 domain-containing protein [Rhodopseudomonas sp. BR0C11]|uniref:DUF2971 domain-containing protein n=1 Tax=Rhodopseudomonas sp. BR0C11 TaxID=2269370 RepID=UPI0013DFD8CB|nr:DUF2971 domain-containing protein [Rhodopseudomonas sp. BR0C11]NEV75925.1 DUF2971 domain-containing protein [Rhodopseudomonas sp. BR0C11]
MRILDGIEVDWTERLWRYCTLDRFDNLLRTSSLYFASANQFDDPFEGAVAVQTDTPPTDPRYLAMERTEHAFFQLKRLTKLHCWHRGDFESDAMWKLYSGESKGIAVCSSPERIRTALKPFRLKPEFGTEDFWCGQVKYIDLTQVRMNSGMLERFYFKHRVFEWEREFRLAVSLRTAEEFGVPVPEDGISISVDLEALVELIFIGPSIPPEERRRAEALIEEFGLQDRVRYSSLLGRPRYI